MYHSDDNNNMQTVRKCAKHITYNISFNPCKVCEVGASYEEWEAQRSEITLIQSTWVLNHRAGN
jgi:hypothetical protein